ncbi:MAG: FMN-binding protein [Oscillospiraceae bacterium]|nr:FMN-binding protein [Oscillospiraceae bacterium]
MNKILKLTLILFLVSAVVAGVLGGVYIVTEKPIAENNAKVTREAYAAVMPEGVGIDPMNSVDVGETVSVNGASISLIKYTAADDGKTYVVEAETSGSQGNIVIAVGVDKETGTCTGIAIVSSSETSGLGAEASKPAFSNQLVGADNVSCFITKEGGTVEAISGATITSKAVTRSVAAAIDFVTNLG